ncbi:Protein C8orf37 [Clonorchis sinensis]|uniref:Cilia- and flagella-associated protein 418 n=1 Tax=Clonorchis sinensis TaxID=79923 RepID=A0A8T1M4P1_CLOSI|nr:Protein C8orf37 [Clonorchis sinensis]
MDDLDDLLQDVQNTYPNKTPTVSSIKILDQGDLDRDISEMLEDKSDELTNLEKRSDGCKAASESTKCGAAADMSICHRCSVPCIAGVEMSLGWNKACNTLRCIACDNAVVIFDNSSWSSDVDYYFLRTNYPNTKRLQAKMKRKGGSRAYCCQCSSTEATKLTCLDGIPSLQWVCGKHAM